MKKFLLAFLFLLAQPVYGQVGFGGMFPGPGTPASGGGGGSYTGPGDAKAHAFFYGTIAYSSATRGTNAVEVCDGASCVSVASDATTGIVPNPSPNGSDPCDNSTHQCTVRTWYDQLGGTYDQVQATATNRAIWVPAGSCPSTFGATVSCAVNNGANTRYTSAGTWTQAQPIFFSGAYNRNTGVSASVQIFTGGTSGIVFGGGFFNAQNEFYCYAGSGGTQRTGITDGVWHAANCTLDNASSNIKIDTASQVTGVAGGTNTFSTVIAFWAESGGARYWRGYFMAGGGGSGSISGAEATALNSAYQTIGGF